MNPSELLIDMYGRIDGYVHGVVDGLDGATLTTQPSPETNTIAWLVWHLTRVQDHHVADAFGLDQVWVRGDWGPRFGVTSDPDNTGYGHSADEVRTIQPESGAALVDYYDAVAARTKGILRGLTEGDLDRIVDERWDPPVTLGVRLVSVADDDSQHAGQAAYVRGLLTT
jgi:hypothetical protein